MGILAPVWQKGSLVKKFCWRNTLLWKMPKSRGPSCESAAVEGPFCEWWGKIGRLAGGEIVDVFSVSSCLMVC